MPEEENKTVDIDTSGPDATVDIEETKDESVVETGSEKQKTRNKKHKKQQKNDELEDYSKGVQARIAKLTRKMREAERREKAAVDYARAVEEKRRALEERFEKTDSEYVKKFETSIKTGLEAAQKELAAAIEAGDAAGQVELTKESHNLHLRIET